MKTSQTPKLNLGKNPEWLRWQKKRERAAHMMTELCPKLKKWLAIWWKAEKHCERIAKRERKRLQAEELRAFRREIKLQAEVDRACYDAFLDEQKFRVSKAVIPDESEQPFWQGKNPYPVCPPVPLFVQSDFSKAEEGVAKILGITIEQLRALPVPAQSVEIETVRVDGRVVTFPILQDMKHNDKPRILIVDDPMPPVRLIDYVSGGLAPLPPEEKTKVGRMYARLKGQRVF